MSRRSANVLCWALSLSCLSLGCGEKDASSTESAGGDESGGDAEAGVAGDVSDALPSGSGDTSEVGATSDGDDVPTSETGTSDVGETGTANSDSGAGSVAPSDGESGATGDAGQGGPAVAKENIGDVVFDENEVRSYNLTFSDAEYARLMDLSTLLRQRTVVNEDRYVQASLRMDDTELPAIEVRFKGQFSLTGCVDGTGTRRVRVESYYRDIDVCQRFSLKLDFNNVDQDARLDGLKQLNLHAMAADPSKMRERLGYSLYRDMGILTPRAVHARVFINGEYHGLFAAVEEVDGRFTANRFPDSGDGNVYKEIWPSEHITSTAAAAALRTNEEPEVLDVSGFVNFKDAAVTATEENFATQLAPFIDFDYLARFVVVNRAINDFDGIMAFYFGWGPPPANHNLFWYHDTESGQFMLIPWDLDKSLWAPEPNFWFNNEPHGENVTPNWNVVTNNCDGYTAWFDNLGESYQMMAIDCDPLLRLLRGHVYDSQKAITDEFLEGPFSEVSVKVKLDTWRAQIVDAVEEDALMDSQHFQDSVDALLADLPEFHGNVRLMMDGLIDE
jgi:hypothetical protein